MVHPRRKRGRPPKGVRPINFTMPTRIVVAIDGIKTTILEETEKSVTRSELIRSWAEAVMEAGQDLVGPDDRRSALRRRRG